MCQCHLAEPEPVVRPRLEPAKPPGLETAEDEHFLSSACSSEPWRRRRQDLDVMIITTTTTTTLLCLVLLPEYACTHAASRPPQDKRAKVNLKGRACLTGEPAKRVGGLCQRLGPLLWFR